MVTLDRLRAMPDASPSACAVARCAAVVAGAGSGAATACDVRGFPGNEMGAPPRARVAARAASSAGDRTAGTGCVMALADGSAKAESLLPRGTHTVGTPLDGTNVRAGRMSPSDAGPDTGGTTVAVGATAAAAGAGAADGRDRLRDLDVPPRAGAVPPVAALGVVLAAVVVKLLAATDFRRRRMLGLTVAPISCCTHTRAVRSLR